MTQQQHNSPILVQCSNNTTHLFWCNAATTQLTYFGVMHSCPINYKIFSQVGRECCGCGPRDTFRATHAAHASKWVEKRWSSVCLRSCVLPQTNGTSNGLLPMLRVYNNTARYVDQGGNKVCCHGYVPNSTCLLE